MMMSATPQRGDFVRVRTRRWLVEESRVDWGFAALVSSLIESSGNRCADRGRP